MSETTAPSQRLSDNVIINQHIHTSQLLSDMWNELPKDTRRQVLLELDGKVDSIKVILGQTFDRLELSKTATRTRSGEPRVTHEEKTRQGACLYSGCGEPAAEREDKNGNKTKRKYCEGHLQKFRDYNKRLKEKSK